MAGGSFITFEGGEGAGKSTQIARLSERLRAEGIAVTVTREPGGSPFAEEIRALVLGGTASQRAPEAEALLFYAARADLLASVIRPALDAGSWVLCDRFSDSTRAYQGAGSGASPVFIDQLDALVVGETRPDLTVLLDVPAEIGLARARARASAGASGNSQGAPDRFEQAELAFHQRLRDGFLALARREPQRFAIIDGMQGADDVAMAIWGEVQQQLRKRLRS